MALVSCRFSEFFPFLDDPPSFELADCPLNMSGEKLNMEFGINVTIDILY